MMRRALTLLALGISAAFASNVAQAHMDVGVYFGVPGPVYVAPPPVVYQSPPVVYAPVPAYGYGYRDEYWEERRWHDNGRHRAWYRHRYYEDDDD